MRMPFPSQAFPLDWACDPFHKDLDRVTSSTKVTFEPKLQSGRHRLSQESQGPGWECAVDQNILFLYHCIHTKYDFFFSHFGQLW